jgi:predicted transcriptional regulator YheO
MLGKVTREATVRGQSFVWRDYFQKLKGMMCANLYRKQRTEAIAEIEVDFLNFLFKKDSIQKILTSEKRTANNITRLLASLALNL